MKYDDFDENNRLDSREKYTGHLAPLVSQAGLQDYIELAWKYLDHLPDDILIPLFTSLTALFKSKAYALTAVQPAENSTSGSGSFDSAQYRYNPESSRSISNSKKRAARDGDGESPDTDDEGHHKKRRLKGESNSKDRRKWACPFYQREPYRYCVETEFGDFRKCARSPGFDQVHRVKSVSYSHLSIS
jgi:hypothetical protein